MNHANIIYVLHRNEPSETFIRREIDALQARGLPLTVYTLDPPTPATGVPATLQRALLRALAVRLLTPPVSLTYGLRLIRHTPHALRLASVASSLPSPRLHAQFAWAAADASGLAAAALGIPWTCSVHAWDVFTRPPRETRARLATAVKITACTDRARNALHAARIPASRIHLIRHGLDPACLTFVPTRSGDRIAAVGRLVPKKGFDTLLTACADVRRRGVPFECTLVGDGPDRTSLEQMAKTLGIADAVRFSGWLPAVEAQRVITDATVLALPSRRLANADSDGFANVLSEAMFLGTPVITTAAGAATELLADHANARIVPPDDPTALAAALTDLLTDPNTRLRLAVAARKTAEAHLDQQRLIDQWVAFLNRKSQN